MAPEYTCRRLRQCAILSIRLSDSFLTVHLSVTRHAGAHGYCHQGDINEREQIYGIFNTEHSTSFSYIIITL